MIPSELKVDQKPELSNPVLLLGFSGWMNGDQVSTGAVEYLIEKFQARKFAQIEPADFYIYNFPGPMELSAMFRPHTKIENGIIRTYQPPANDFFSVQSHNLILFVGREPNLAWRQYADCIISLCEQFNVKEIYFIGSVAGLTPHTREPRIFCSVSDEELKASLQQHGIHFTNYEGPASIVSYLTFRSKSQGIGMLNLVAEIPAYVQGHNYKCIETIIRYIASLLNLNIQYDDIRTMADEFEKKLDEAVQHEPKLVETIRKLEQAYDDEVFDTEMTNLKQWLEQRGVRVD